MIVNAPQVHTFFNDKTCEINLVQEHVVQELLL